MKAKGCCDSMDEIPRCSFCLHGGKNDSWIMKGKGVRSQKTVGAGKGFKGFVVAGGYWQHEIISVFHGGSTVMTSTDDFMPLSPGKLITGIRVRPIA